MHPYFGKEAEAFNRGETVELFVMAPEGSGSQQLELTHDPATDITDEMVREQLHAGRWYTVERNGRTYELMVFNYEHAEDGADAFFSTYSSSIQGNPGNAYEAAATAARYPDRTLVYVASPGNGGSSALSRREMSRYAATGSMTEHNIPMDYVQNLAAVLAERNLNVRSIIGHSAGTAVALALGRALPKGQLESMVLYAAPHATAVNPLSLAVRALGLEGLLRGRQSQKHVFDAAAVNGRRAAFVSEEHPEIYRNKAPLRQLLGRVAMLATNMVALAHGSEALTHGLDSLYAQQPDAAVTVVVPEQDGLHTNDLAFNMRGTIDAVADKHPSANIRAVFLPAAQHAFNTYNPTLVDELTHISLGRRAHQRTAAGTAAVS